MEVQGQKNIKMFCKDYVERAEVCFFNPFKAMYEGNGTRQNQMFLVGRGDFGKFVVR